MAVQLIGARTVLVAAQSSGNIIPRCASNTNGASENENSGRISVLHFLSFSNYSLENQFCSSTLFFAPPLIGRLITLPLSRTAAARKAVIERQARQLLGRLAPQLDLDFEAEVEDEPEEEEEEDEAAEEEDQKEAAKEAAQGAAETAVQAEAQSAPAAEGAASNTDAVAQALENLAGGSADASAAASAVLSPGNEAPEGERREGEGSSASSAQSSDAVVAADSSSVVEGSAAAVSSSLLPVVVVAAAAATTSTGTGADTVLVAPRLKVQTVSAKQRRANASFPAAALSVAPGIEYFVFRFILGLGIWDLERFWFGVGS